MAASPPPEAVKTRPRARAAWWLVVAGLLIGLVGPAHARGRRAAKGRGKGGGRVTATAGAETHRAFPGVHLLALADDQILLWEANGHAQLRTSDGNWSADMQLPAAGIQDVQRDGNGFLVAGALAAGGAAVVALSAAGQPQARWSIPGESASAVFTDAAGRHLVTRAGIVDLRADGTIGKAQPFPADPRPAGGASLPIVLARPGDDEGALVICAPSGPATPASANPTRGVCERPAPAGWRLEEDFAAAPVVCGGSIVVTTAAGAGARAREGAIVAYAWDSGKIQNRGKAAGTPAIACAADGDALMVGDKQLRLFHLPSLKPAWTHPVGRAAVHDVAVTKHFIAYQAGDSLDVTVVPRPPAAR